MAGAIPINNTVSVALIAQKGSEQRVNVIHYSFLTAITLADLISLANEMDPIIGQLAAFSGINERWYRVFVKDLDPFSLLEYDRAVSVAGPTSLADMPSNVSHCLTKRSGLAGRDKRGRFYLHGLEEDYFNGDIFNTAYGPQVTQLAVRLLAPRVSGKFIPCIGSRKNHVSTQMLSITWDDIADSQRRRLPGRGN